MARQVWEEHLLAIEEVLREHPEGRTASQIKAALTTTPPRRTLQYRLKSLVDGKRIVVMGTGRRTRYRVPRLISLAAQGTIGDVSGRVQLEVVPALSREGTQIWEHVRQPLTARRPVGYDRAFLDSYRPNETFYLSQAEREHLGEVGRPGVADQPAGPYARQILHRFPLHLPRTSPRPHP
ncbi:MAG: hypothetical protein OXC12_09145, partial [Spirochaetaceae bacterium]|nr:hypothetical protein [Spirochaetaceae bacterium]